MALRDEFSSSMKDAMRAGDKMRLSTIRLITSSVKDREIEARGTGKEIGEDDILALLQKMVKQRQESLKIYEDAGRMDLAEQERGEIAVITGFLPQQMDEAAVAAAVREAVAAAGATSVKDMGGVMAALKAKYAGQMDFAKASAAVKMALTG